MGDTILHNLNLAEYITDSEDSYIEKAVALASDLTRLSDLSGRLRDTLLSSPLCDPATFTRDLEGIYRTLWTRWCHNRTTPQV
jgi:predicted O-linked N-acetylglucosamine transferase (SPINDLY family)